MRIYMHEMKVNFKSLLIWSGSLGLLIVIAVAKFSAFYNNPESLALLDSMPQGMLDALNMRAFTLTTLSGFYGVMFTYFGLIGAMAAAMWGSDIISKEERDRTVEFSLVLPLSRAKVITPKILAALTNCVLMILITWGISQVAVQPYKPDAAFQSFLRMEMLAMFLIELIFLAVGILLGSAMKQYKRAGSMAITTILVSYFVYLLSRMSSNLNGLRFLTPFRYFDAVDFFKTGTFEGPYLALGAGIVVFCLAAAYWTYNRRDLYI